MTVDRCPHEEKDRARLCVACCAQHDLPPCVRGWLAEQVTRRRQAEPTVLRLTSLPPRRLRAA